MLMAASNSGVLASVYESFHYIGSTFVPNCMYNVNSRISRLFSEVNVWCFSVCNLMILLTRLNMP